VFDLDARKRLMLNLIGENIHESGANHKKKKFNQISLVEKFLKNRNCPSVCLSGFFFSWACPIGMIYDSVDSL
jgi:hypothetical protein